MARRRQNKDAGYGCLVLLIILFLILKKIYIFLKPFLIGILNFITDPNVFIPIGIISITIVIIYYVIKYLKEKQKKKAEEERRRLAAIEAEKERIRAIERERQRLEREYQHGYTDDMTGYEYERYCTGLFINFNWDAKTTKLSGDSGGDIIATKNGIKIVAQCKKWTNKVNFRAVEEVWAAKGIYKTHYAIVITNSNYTKQAIRDAKKLGVVLLRHPELEDWLQKLIPEKQESNIKQRANIEKSIRKENAPYIEKEIILNLYNSITLEEWTNKYKDKLEPYIDFYKMSEGDDFDIYKESYNSWKESNESDVNTDEWVDGFINATTKIMKELEEKYGPIDEFTDEIINKIIEDEKENNL